MTLQSSPQAITLFVFTVGLALAASLIAWSQTRECTETPTLDWPGALFVSVVGVTIFTGWAGTVLASFGLFSLVALSACLWPASLFLLWTHRPIRQLRFARAGRPELALGILLVGGSIVYFRPHEYVLGGADAGGYMNIGATVAQTGDFIISDDWTAVLRDHAEVTLRRQPEQWEPEYLQFVGWYIDDEDPSRVIPQFFPFHPILIAVGISLGGLSGGLLVTPLWGVLGLAAIYFLCRQLFGPHTGLLAVILVAITATHIYFARYPTTEPLTLLLVFAGLLAFQRLWDRTTAAPIWGIFGGAAIGAAFLTRIDLPLLSLLLVVILVVRWQQKSWSRAWTAFALTLGLLTAHATLSALLISWPYTWNTYSSVFRMLDNFLPIVLAGVMAGALLVTTAILSRDAARSAVTRARQAGSAYSRHMRGLTAIFVIVLSAYAYFLRPVLEPVRTYNTWPAGTEALLLNGQNWVRLGWYLTPLGLFLATAGLAWILWREPLGRLVFFLAVGVMTTIQYVYNIFNTPYHIYAMRRYVPIVIPMLMIYAAVAIVALFQARPRRLARVAGGALATALIAGLVYQARFVLPLRDFAGATGQLTALSARLEPEALLVISEPAESIFADTFGTPLRYIFGHDIATIRADDRAAQLFIAAMRAYAAAQQRPLQLIAVEPIPPVVRDALHLRPRGMVPVRLDLLMNTFSEFPSTIQTAYYGIEIYDVDGAAAAPEPSKAITIDVGTLDTAYINGGFYYKEPLPGPITMRWTAGEAALEIPFAAEGDVTVDIRAMTYRPDNMNPESVSVWLDGERIGAFEPVDEAWHTFSFQAHGEPTNGTSLLEFKTATMNPSALQLSADTRDLGFLVDWVKVRAQ